MVRFEQITDDIEARNNEYFETYFWDESVVGDIKYFQHESVVVEITNWSPISPATRNSQLKGGEVEFNIFDSLGQDITDKVRLNTLEYSSIRDEAIDFCVELTKGDNYEKPNQ